MKKIVSIVMILVMALTCSVSAFAAPTGFVASPAVDSVKLDSFDNETESCVAEIILTPYAEKGELDAETKTALDAAYKAIVNNAADYTKALDAIAAAKKVAANRLAVSDLFDVTVKDDAGHEQHGTFTVTLTANNLDKFVALLHCNNGAWTTVEDVKIEGNKLTFTSDEFSPFAIVVATGSATDSPATGDNSNLALWIALLAVSAGAIVVLAVSAKKKAVR